MNKWKACCLFIHVLWTLSLLAVLVLFILMIAGIDVVDIVVVVILGFAVGVSGIILAIFSAWGECHRQRRQDYNQIE
jgi:hypothetical protein